ncbi:MAG: hypothetical protein JXA04_03045 [Gammaproteobacteria bacterium]|nr:hypothetical protein [Gammaproteobacteria bacterium]
MQRILIFFVSTCFVLAFLGACGGSGGSDETSTGETAPVFPGDGLLVDHNAALAFEDIPDCWLDQAKQLTLHYAHTSHGGQIIEGLNYLENFVADKYRIAIRAGATEGLPAVEDPPALRIYDGNPGDTYVTPERYWDGQTAINWTRSVADTGHYDYSMWSWCTQQSDNSVETVNRYLATMSAFESEYSSMRFILMTGRTDGDQDTNPDSVLRRNNNMVRDYARDHEMVLFDFADLEKYDPNNVFHPDVHDTCNTPDGYWCGDWCSDYPDQCPNSLASLGCTHSSGPVCFQKAKAFWWMMARLAGWNGEAGQACN